MKIWDSNYTWYVHGWNGTMAEMNIFDKQTSVIYLVIRQWSDLKHFIPGTGSPELQG